MILQPLFVIRILSLVIGIAAIWLMTAKKEYNKIMECYLSVLTTWLFAFIGAKVITQGELLLSYPVSVLSYPSGTEEFYIACAVTVLWEWRHRKVHIKNGQEYVFMLAVLPMRV
ncbi:hypothetical protein [Halobacillus sp. Nhm2S1]|uniref:hypothetical protein n=1 Tax=Halobacillus sp. Nhm2S1 TaxID=2866716 RepID=UPI001C734BE8|nr:hypothetical protein [Halobacillus sp. Nhm2S1]MBX0359444.1 hypothetical protein [Halobacillus sp. Nhm2S1]